MSPTRSRTLRRVRLAAAAALAAGLPAALGCYEKVVYQRGFGSERSETLEPAGEGSVPRQDPNAPVNEVGMPRHNNDK